MSATLALAVLSANVMVSATPLTGLAAAGPSPTGSTAQDCTNADACQGTSLCTKASDCPSTDPALNFNNSPCKDAGNCDLITKYVNPFIRFLAVLAVLAVIAGIIWGSIEFATAGGDSQRVASGKSKIQKALIGLLALIFLYAFLQWLIPGGVV